VPWASPGASLLLTVGILGSVPMPASIRAVLRNVKLSPTLSVLAHRRCIAFSGACPFDRLSIPFYIQQTWCAMATEPSTQPSFPHPGKPVMPASVAFERHYCVSEVAELWGLSERTIRRIFSDEPGVKWESGETRFKRGYTTLRIPESVVQRVHRKLRKAG
jgi:hypothetical protein